MDTRSPYAAGLFYLGYEEGLRKDVGRLLSSARPIEKKVTAKGIVVPHAGYEYSGKVAGAVFASIVPPARYIVIGPNHSGFGKPVSIEDSGEWKTPLGNAMIDNELAKAMLAESDLIQANKDANRYEHSVEVEIPFIQALKENDFAFVPMVVKGMADIAVYKEVGAAIAKAIKETAEDVLIVASSDFTHYEPQSVAETMDQMAIKEILALDPEGLLRTVFANDITMCGYGPVSIMLFAAIELGASHAELVKYSTSGAATMDTSSVVGYGGLIVS